MGCAEALQHNSWPQAHTSTHTFSRVHVQYPSIKSLRSTIVEQSFYGASVFAERRSRTVSVPFRLSSVPFRFHSVLLANQRDQCEVSVNASFGSEDDLQLLQMVAEGSRYESASFCVAAQPIAIQNHGSLIMHELSKR